MDTTSTVSDEELVARLPDTLIDHDNKEFHRGLLQRRLLLMRCGECGTWRHPPRPVCGACWSMDVRPTEVAGRGIIHLLVLLHQGPPAPGVDYTAGPHPVAVVELEEQEGLRFTSTVIDCAPDALRIGLPVELAWIERYGEPFPVFRPRSEVPA